MIPDYWPHKVNIKPLSVNKCWQGRRFKTQDYKQYEKDVLIQLKPMEIPEGGIKLIIEAGLSNKAADLDNIAKPFIDILQKKYGFNDSQIYGLTMIKVLVKKGEEYIEYIIESLYD